MSTAPQIGGRPLVIAAITTTRGLSGSDIGDITGLKQQTVVYHLKRLVAAGLVDRYKDGTKASAA